MLELLSLPALSFDKLPFTRREARDAARLALQSAAAAAGTFLLMRSLGLPEEFVGVLSAVLVVQPSAGNTLGAAQDRVVATLVGSGIGIVCLLLLPSGYGTAVALAVSMLVMNALAGLRPEWRYGSVAAVALSLGSAGSLFDTALDRSVAIALGAAVGAAVTFVVWPDSATKRARRHLRAALRATAERLDAAVESARSEEHDDAAEARDKYHENLRNARKAAAGIRFGKRRAVDARIDATERLYNSALIMNRVAEETNRATEGDAELDEAVEAIRDAACKATLALAGEEEEEAPGDHLETIRSQLERARAAVARRGPDDPREHIFRATMVFGLGEVMDSLEDLIEAAREKPD